jgi:hypothetical protein
VTSSPYGRVGSWSTGPYGVYCDGCDENVFSGLRTHDNYESGFQLQGSSSDNLILNPDGYGNRDPRKNGESADGLAIKEGSGTGNVVRGARLWSNVDDGFDANVFGGRATLTAHLSVADTKAAADGSLPSAPGFLVPRKGSAVGARF